MAQAHRCAYQRKGRKSYAFSVDLEQSVAEVATGRRRPASARLVGRQRRYSAPLLWDLPSGDIAELTQFGGRNGQLSSNGPHLLRRRGFAVRGQALVEYQTPRDQESMFRHKM